ncbi:MBL fold metallo-hydrolase [Ideonella sp. BN130291]|uniref:MBL fold metallo-hydrolase n=1 Tax=Ideonella sp. BN130291 TaxID=3112940 RepID=UPI002E272348|nr:MBL fold metallo-hydrolase [Ideonella sp. BN130291]
MRFCNLGSGSSGNATLIEAQDGSTTVRVLVDCGLTLRELTARLAQRGCSPADLGAVFVTHEHSDHVGCATALMRKHRVPVWMSEGTWRGFAREHAPPAELRFARDGEPVAVGTLELRPYTVPHDAREPLQLTVSDGRHRLGVLTDAGVETERIVQELQHCTALLLECNHDLDLLAASDYPYFLKRRIAGPRGHLSNPSAAGILSRCRHAGLKHVVAAHLSERNNRPELAAGTLAEVLGTRHEDIVVADPRQGSPWLDLH